MKTFIFEQLFQGGLITEEKFKNIEEKETIKPIPLHTELKLMMYAGIVLLTTGLGIVVYNNMDNLSRLTVVLAVAIATVFCFVYCLIKSARFSNRQSSTPTLIPDYTLLLGCILLLILTGYLQFEFNIFGDRWGMATFVPMVVLFVSAYYFDHLGVLSMAIVNMAAWAGISVTPKHLLRNNDFNDSTIIYTALVLGLLLLFVAYISAKKDFKAHFSFTYKNFGVQILFIAANAAIIYFQRYEVGWLIFLAGICFWQFSIARNEKSFYFLTITILYFYFGLSYVVIRNLFKFSWGEGPLYVAFFYFIITAILAATVLMRFNKIFKK